MILEDSLKNPSIISSIKINPVSVLFFEFQFLFSFLSFWFQFWFWSFGLVWTGFWFQPPPVAFSPALCMLTACMHACLPAACTATCCTPASLCLHILWLPLHASCLPAACALLSPHAFTFLHMPACCLLQHAHCTACMLLPFCLIHLLYACLLLFMPLHLHASPHPCTFLLCMHKTNRAGWSRTDLTRRTEDRMESQSWHFEAGRTWPLVLYLLPHTHTLTHYIATLPHLLLYYFVIQHLFVLLLSPYVLHSDHHLFVSHCCMSTHCTVVIHFTCLYIYGHLFIYPTHYIYIADLHIVPCRPRVHVRCCCIGCGFPAPFTICYHYIPCLLVFYSLYIDSSSCLTVSSYPTLRFTFPVHILYSLCNITCQFCMTCLIFYSLYTFIIPCSLHIPDTLQRIT